MIDIKGTRSIQSATDPYDPMGLRKPEDDNTRSLAGLVGGLISLGIYMRSFLWADPVAPVSPEDPAPVKDDDGLEGGGAPRRQALLLAATEKAPVGDYKEIPADDAMAVGPFRFPVVFGRFESGLIAPFSASGFGLDLPRSYANTLLPPFEWFQGKDTAVRNSSPQGSDAAGVTVASIDQAVIDDLDGEMPDLSDDDEDTDGQDRNRAPRNTGPVYLGDVGSGAAVAFAMSHFLSQTTDPDGDLLQVSMGEGTSGLLDQRGAGWRYLADTDFLGDVRIDYTITDGFFEVAQTAFLNVVANSFTGSDDDDLIVGTHGRDVIMGLGGDDNLAGMEGRDTIDGGKGNDNIAGGDGADFLFGGDGDDLIAGGNGRDWISGGVGNDSLFGEEGDDEIYGDAGDDDIYGGQGSDQLFGGDGNDVILGGAGEDLLSGDSGQDRLYGESGEDVIFAGLGNDTAYGGEGNDLLFGGEGADLLYGGEGDDVLTGEEGRDLLVGGAGNDVLQGGADEDTVAGGAGNDLVIADDDALADDYDGGDGEDQLNYSAATEAVSVDLVAGIVFGESTGSDSFANFEQFVGSAGDDTFHAGAGTAELTGNGGADIYNFVQGDTVDIIRSMYRITDFDSDDEIWIGPGASQTQIRKAQKSIEDRIEDGLDDFADDMGADEPQLSFRHDWTDTYRRTVIEVDFDRDSVVDLEIIMEGEHVFVVEHV